MMMVHRQKNLPAKIKSLYFQSSFGQRPFEKKIISINQKLKCIITITSTFYETLSFASYNNDISASPQQKQ
jgi:hypothetical protein